MNFMGNGSLRRQSNILTPGWCPFTISCLVEYARGEFMLLVVIQVLMFDAHKCVLKETKRCVHEMRLAGLGAGLSS
jgi:hypothetical protein